MFDNLFSLSGTPCTSLMLFGILAVVAAGPVGSLLFPKGVLGQTQYRPRL